MSWQLTPCCTKQIYLLSNKFEIENSNKLGFINNISVYTGVCHSDRNEEITFRFNFLPFKNLERMGFFYCCWPRGLVRQLFIYTTIKDLVIYLQQTFYKLSKRIMLHRKLQAVPEILRLNKNTQSIVHKERSLCIVD